MKLTRLLVALLALAFGAQVHAASLGSVQTGQGSWPTVLAPDINDDFTNLYATPFITLGNQSVYSTERAIAAGTCLTGTDGGANSSYTFGITGGCIGTTQIGTDGVASDEIAANAVGLSEMGDDSVGIDELDFITGDVPANGDCITYDTAAGGTLEAIVCPGSAGGDSVTVNGAAIVDPDLDNATPAAPAGSRNVSWQESGSDVSAYLPYQTENFCVAASDETTNLTTGTAKVTFRMPYAFTVTAVRASVATAATGASLLTVDVNEAGTTIISTKLTLDASEKTTTTAATPPVISDSALADDAEMTIDIDQVGSTTPGKGLKVCIIGHQ